MIKTVLNQEIKSKYLVILTILMVNKLLNNVNLFSKKINGEFHQMENREDKLMININYFIFPHQFKKDKIGGFNSRQLFRLCNIQQLLDQFYLDSMY